MVPLIRLATWADLAVRQAAGELWVLILCFMPWSIWLACAIFQAFSTSSAGSRGKLFLGWVWFVVSLPLVFLNNITHTTQFFIPIICSGSHPSSTSYSNKQATSLDQGRYIRIWRAFRWVHLLVIVICNTRPAYRISI